PARQFGRPVHWSCRSPPPLRRRSLCRTLKKSGGVPRCRTDRSWQCSYRQKRFKAGFGLPRGAALFVWPADHSIIADITLPKVRRGGQKGLSKGVANRFGNPVNRITRSLVERNNLLGEASGRRAEIEAA